MKDTYIGDDYRVSEEGVQTYNGILVFGTMAMHPEELTQDSAKAYASVVNEVADSLPGVNTYNILIPTSDEFYAPKSYYKDQLSAFKTVYENLNDNVTAVNAVKPLWDHASEKIYFSLTTIGLNAVHIMLIRHLKRQRVKLRRLLIVMNVR